MVDVDHNGLKEWCECLDKAQKQAPKLLISELTREGNMIVSAYKKKVKTEAKSKNGKKHLHNAIQAEKIELNRGDYTRNVVANEKRAPHYHLVEFGHELFSRKGKYLGVVKGKHYFQRTKEEQWEKILERRKKLNNKLYKELM